MVAMDEQNRPRLATNWTSAAGAVDGILDYLEAPLPRHAVMGLTGHAWHLCLGTKNGVVALPSGPSDLDWAAAVERYRLTGYSWERFGGPWNPGDAGERLREDAIAWATERLDAGVPLAGWDFHLHEFGIVWGYETERGGFLVDDVISEEVGPIALWRDWPSAATGQLELFAPVEPVEVDPIETVGAALEFALTCFVGGDGPIDNQPRGTAAFEAWADAFDGEGEVDRAGNAYTLAVLQAARLDGAAFLSDLAESLPPLADPLHRAVAALSDVTKTLAPLLTLFPFPTGGHGNVNNPGLRESAAHALRRAAGHERRAAQAMAEAHRMLEE